MHGILTIICIITYRYEASPLYRHTVKSVQVKLQLSIRGYPQCTLNSASNSYNFITILYALRSALSQGHLIQLVQHRVYHLSCEYLLGKGYHLYFCIQGNIVDRHVCVGVLCVRTCVRTCVHLRECELVCMCADMCVFVRECVSVCADMCACEGV